MSTLEKISFVVDSYLSEKGYSSVCKEYAVLEKWGDIVGERIASVTECMKIDKNSLYVSVKGSSWRHELHFLKQEILNKIKSEYNCQSINDIIFI